MNKQAKVATVMLALSGIMLYIETILQLYISATYHDTDLVNTPAAIVSFSMVLISFLIANILSAYWAHSNMSIENDSPMGTFIFKILHIAYLGLLWRIGKLIASFSEQDVKDFSLIRLFHVGLQSCPYIIFYTSIFISAGSINVVQVLSLISSVTSVVLAICSYNLRLSLCKDSTGAVADTDTDTIFGCARTNVAIVSSLVGTFLIVSIRLISISLMASQEPRWIFVPLGCHFLIVFVIFIGFSSKRKAKSNTVCSVLLHFIWAVGMSIVNCFELVHDKIERLMCKYVGFYSLFLVENIIFLSFWLIRFDMAYSAKLMSVVGILVGFIIGLVAKFSSCNTLRKKLTSSIDSPVPTTFLTITNTSSGASQNMQLNSLDDDLVSIVQASVYRQSLQTPGQQLPNGSARGKNELKRNPENEGEVNKGFREDNEDISGKGGKSRKSCVSLSSVAQAMASDKRNFRKESDSDKPDLDSSFQPDSMFNVSEPGTIPSDMMYAKGHEQLNVETLDSRNSRRLRHYDKSHFKGFPSDTRFLETPHYATEPRGARKKRNLKASNDPSDYPNFRQSSRDRKQMGVISLEPLQQFNEYSDTAISSAKTFPIVEPKKTDYKAYDGSLLYKSNLGRKMGKIIFSLEDRENNDSSRLGINYIVRNAPNSDDDVFRYKLSNAAFQTARNRISYTEPEDVSTSENATSGHDINVKSRLSNRAKKVPMKLSKSDSQRKPNITPALILNPSTLHLCDSGSSSFSSQTMENNAYTKTSSSSSSSSSSASNEEHCWNVAGQQRKDLILPEEDDQITSSESILRWLASTEDTEQEARV